MEIKRLKSNELSDFKNLIEIYYDVFENDKQMPNDNHLSKLLSNNEIIVFIVKVSGKVVGGSTIYTLQSYYTEKPIAYIYDVAISPDFQGQGFGKALISAVCDYCKHNGFEDAYVEAETDDIDAIGFYRKTKFSSELNATHFTYSFDNN